MEFTAEQKAAIEAPLKEALVKLVEAVEIATKAAAENSSNKVDDVVVPALAPMAKAAVVKLVEGMKL